MVNPVSSLIKGITTTSKSTYLAGLVGLVSLGVLTYDSYEHGKSSYRKKTKENLADSITDVYGIHMITGGNSSSTEKMKDWWRRRKLDSKGPIYLVTVVIPGLIGTAVGEVLKNILPLALIGGALFSGKIENKISKSSLLKRLHNSPSAVNVGNKLKGKVGLICAALIGLQSFKGFFTDVMGIGKENPLD
jgi:hypothetical protein